MPSVLDRLCTFTRGILELCDPSTPSWAQARLSELLAEAGLVPVPCQGTPHPDFHQVVGTTVAKDIPAGLIARVEAPGFALRGDRGDLFPQRKAQVRISGDKDELIAPTTPAPRIEVRPAPVRSDAAPTPVAAPAVAATTETAPQVPRADDRQRRDDRPRQDRPRDDRPRRDERQPAPVAPVAPTGDDTTAPVADAGAETAPADSQPRRDDRPRNDRSRDDRRPARQPEQGRDPHRTHGREFPSEAPALPLAQQDPAELAQRPKAEGFRALGLNDQILADLAAMGWNEPSPIQTQAVPVASTGRDIIGQAQTGTGKTGAFVLPLLQRLYAINDQDRRPAALVLCPTRELAKQVHHEFTRMAGTSGARACLIYGGTSMDEQFQALERHPHVVIGTPGRVIDHVKRRTLDLSRLSAVILDEADQMLDIGFWPDVQYVISHTPPTRQIMLFSATFPDPIRQMAEQHMKSPEHVRITPKVVTVDQVDQKFIAVPHDKKTSLLAHFIDTQNPDSMLVFCRTKHQTDRVAEVLKRKNYSAGAIHGDLPQTKRERILSQFRSSELKCLIATNVAARGLDIPIVSHVVNYDIPEMPEEYVHRIGRTARNGAPGVARTFITPEDGQFLLEIEKHIGLLLEEEKVEGFTPAIAPAEQVRTIAETPVGAPRLLKPLVGGLRLGRRRR
jgi:ATP-dependent RNA helicase DeaD